MSPNAKSHIFRNLAKYVRSGMGIEKACQSLLSQPKVPASERQIYQAIEAGVQSGKSISESMSDSSRLERIDFQMLDASEKAGRLEMGLTHLADYHERLHRTRRRIRKGLAYPVFLFHFALIVTTFVTAMISRLITQGELGVWQAIWVNGRWFLIGYVVLLVLAIGGWILHRQSVGSAAADALLNRVPLLGKVRRAASLERFCSVFEIFLLAGMRMDQSLSGAGEASNSGLIRRAAAKGVTQVKQGSLLAPVFFQSASAFPNELARGVASAEEAGVLDVEFGRWKNFYGESLTEAMDQLAEWTPKIVYFTTLFIVAWMIIRVGLSYSQLINSLLEGI